MSSRSNEDNTQYDTQLVCTSNKGYSSMYSVFHVIIGFFAIFLSFKCNRGFDLPDFLLACCCPVLYILYRFAVSPDFCEVTGLPALSSR